MKQIKTRLGGSIVFVLSIFLTFISSFSSFAQVSPEERQALVDFYNATNGANWKNTVEGNQPWLINDSTSLVTDWYGVSVTNGKVTKLDFFKNNLTGTLPNSIGNLTQMNQLVLSSNDIGGELPDSMLSWSNLRSLHLSGNEFTGSLPILKLLNSASTISHLYFDSNNFSGTIPPEIGQFTNLLYINMGYNQLTGSIPVELSQLKKIGSLYFSGNQLSGTIPPQLGEMTSLRSLTFTKNNLTGTIPPELGSLTNLGALSFAGNELTGTIPPELGQLTKLYSLSFNGNNLTGNIPPELGQLVNVIRLYFFGNQFTGSIPTEFGQLVKLENIMLGKNQLTGPIPAEFGLLPKIKNISLDGNQLSGNLPVELGQLTTLVSAHFQGNNFSGQIPSSYTQLTSLKSLYLNGNNLSGKIPAGISTLPNLGNFGITQNKFVFSDFEPEFAAYTANVSGFTYNQMKKSDTEETLNVSIGGTITLATNAFSSPNNTYQWYKNNSAIQGATSKEYVITNATEADAGVYRLLIENNVITALNIYRNDITLTVTQGGTDTCGVSEAEKQALIDLYNATGGASWTNPWDITTPVCDWYGVTVVDGKVTGLNLYNNNLVGTVPNSLSSLVHMQDLRLSDNNVSGDLSTIISPMTALIKLHIGRNNFSGLIPIASLLNKPNIRDLHFESNNFSGGIPAQLGQLTSLASVNLGDNPLTGTIPVELGQLINLLNLHLYKNQLTGTIPSQLGQLSRLSVLSLSDNNLTGTFPIALTGLTNLNSLELNGNQLSGSLPSELGQLTQLYGLSLQSNQFSGSLPAELGQLVNLERFYIYGNLLTGNIPIEFGQLAKLENLHLGGNQLTGSIPIEMAQLANLNVLNVNLNKLSGSIPSELSQIASLRYLQLMDNDFTGSIPTSLTQLTNLVSLYVSGNNLSGKIPASISTMASLENFGIAGNEFVFSDFESEFTAYQTNLSTFFYDPMKKVDDEKTLNVVIGDSITLTSSVFTSANNTYQWYKNNVAITGATSKEYTITNATETDAGVYRLRAKNNVVPVLGIHTNDMTLTVSQAVDTCGVSEAEKQALIALYNSTDGANWTNTWDLTTPVCDWHGVVVVDNKITKLNLNANNLTGTIPAAIGGLINLTHLNLYENPLSGSLPAELGQLINLKSFVLYATQVTGSIPAELGQLTSLETLAFYYNQFTGTIPPELGQMTSLVNLYLGSNQLTGTIPSELGQLSNLQRLDMFNNGLTGSIPVALGGLTKLLHLGLGKNQLTGTVPSELSALVDFNSLNVNQNNFVFSDLEQSFAAYATKLGADFVYVPQNKVDSIQTLSVEAGKSITLSSTALTSTNNVYQWYKDSIAITGANNKDLLIENANDIDAGTYYFTATNSVVTGLTLERNLITLTVTPVVDVCGVSDIEKQALIDLYNSTDGTNWTNTWDLTTPVCSWYGVIVVDGKVTEININNNNLSGPIPISISNLSNLQILSLNRNKITGAIPLTITSLANLKEIILYLNEIDGVIPSDIGNLSNLEQFHMAFNKVTGTIPSSFGNLAKLSFFNVDGNKLDGQVPVEFGNLNRLQRFNVSHNQLTGVLPDSLKNLSSLLFFRTQGNSFTGRIPVDLNLQPNIITIETENNNFIFSDLEPDIIAYVAKIGTNFVYAPQSKVDSIQTLSVEAGKSITLSSTALTSTNNVYQWYKDSIAITGATSKDLLIENASDTDAGTYYFTATNSVVTDLTLERNPITLEVTPTTSVCTAIPTPDERLALEQFYNATNGASWTNNTNWLTDAPICDWYGITVVNNEIVSLELPNNNLVGDVSSVLFDFLANLETFDVKQNNLTGSLQDLILRKLKVLNISNNNFTGSLDFRRGLVSLTHLDASNNNFSGELILENIAEDPSRLTFLDLSSNQFEGLLPEDLYLITGIETFDVSNNNFVGEVSIGQFGNSTALSKLDLSNNDFSALSLVNTSSIVNLSYLGLQDNRFKFLALETHFADYVTKFGANFKYAPQAKVDNEQTLSVAANKSITLTSSDLISTNNVYQWYKDSLAIAGANSKDLLIENASDTDAGMYYFIATNTEVTGLTLERNPIILEVTPAVSELGVTVNTRDLPNSEFDIVYETTTIAGLISGNADSETFVNLGADTGGSKTVFINVKPSQNAAALSLRFSVNSTTISNVQVQNNANWLDFSPEFYRIEGNTIFFINKKGSSSVPFTLNLINGVQYDSSTPLTLKVNDNIDLNGATLRILPPGFDGGDGILVQPSTIINGFIVNTNLFIPGSYRFILNIQGKLFEGRFLVIENTGGEGGGEFGGEGNASF